MRVLLTVSDLYLRIGGGETVYKKIIESSPQIEFFYFCNEEHQDAVRPKNATAIPLGVVHPVDVLMPPPFPLYKKQALEHADLIAKSVSGMTFDIVEVADYFAFGGYLRDALLYRNVNFKRIVLAMHGNLSTSLDMQWGSAGNNVLELKLLEKEQFEKVDYAYGLSERYISSWQSRINRPVALIDPLSVIDFSFLSDRNSEAVDDLAEKPSLYCVGRTERLKGNDLFIELVRWIQRDLYKQAAHVGSCVGAVAGIDSEFILKNISAARGVCVPFLGAKSSEDLRGIFCKRSMLILPVRYDTLNLVVLEALFSGCPVAVSSEAGVCDYLDKYFPTLPYIKIDFNNFFAAVPLIEAVLRDYDAYCQKLRAAVRSVLPYKKASLDMMRVYREALNHSCHVKGAGLLAYREMPVRITSTTKKLIKKVVPVSKIKGARQFILTRIAQNKNKLMSFRIIRLFREMILIRQQFSRISVSSENSCRRMRKKLQEIYGMCGLLFRCNFWSEIGRIEAVLNNKKFSVTYDLRVLRLIGADVYGRVQGIISTLNEVGHPQEALAVKAMYEEPQKSVKTVRKYLQESFNRNRIKTPVPPEMFIDHRFGVPKVAIIISLYNAASKLEFFITTLCQQELVKKSAESVEFIFIDSGSPTEEKEIIAARLEDKNFNAVYIRSAERETIQAAWNRGVLSARAPYLVFLGVDETLYPDALEKLKEGLDKNPSVDWVMSNSLVTNVDERGVFVGDVMAYDRSGAHKEMFHLESCYVAYVGGMYRKSIHERFGFYDETFRGAGDTEFKNRVLPQINVLFIPETLSLFLNYPEERTTASPMAEIEDLRAWYIYRSPGGIRYAFEKASSEEIFRLLMKALGYRKSYCGHISSDIEYAKYLADYLMERNYEKDRVSTLASDLGGMLKILRSLELTQKVPASIGCAALIFSAWMKFCLFERKHRKLFPEAQPVYAILNDNRFEQHSWLWKSNPS